MASLSGTVSTKVRLESDMNAEQVSRLLGVSAKTVHRHIAKGTITATYRNAQELEITDDQVEKLRIVLASDRESRQMSDVNLALSRQITDITTQLATMSQQIRNLEQRVSQLEADATTSISIDHMRPIYPDQSKQIVETSPTEKPQNRSTEPSESAMSLKDFADISGIPARTLHNWIDAGKIEVTPRAKHSGGGVEYLISPEEQQKALQIRNTPRRGKRR